MESNVTNGAPADEPQARSATGAARLLLGGTGGARGDSALTELASLGPLAPDSLCMRVAESGPSRASAARSAPGGIMATALRTLSMYAG
mmetsp:Transcript_8353/g.28407  ORF Transcript_8353/g.28407 Transcript_8353/m.28407 type:complete len:89 (-) Transcript_8353:598-864(-)